MTRNYSSENILPKIEAQLAIDERLLWIGRPTFRRMLTVPVNDGIEPFVTVTFGLIVTGAMAFVLFSGITGSPQILSVLLLIALLLALTFVPVVSLYYDAKNTIYAVTTHRALILQGDAVTSFGAGDINKLIYYNAQDGTGDIIFKSVVHKRFMSHGYIPYPVEVEEQIGFFGIANPRRVYGLLLNTFRTSPIPMWQDVPESTQFHPRKATASA